MHENPLDKIQSYYEELTKTDKEIAYFFINHTHDAITGMNSEDVAKATKTSKAAISRFCQRIGYNGWSDFRFDLTRSLMSSNDDVSGNNDTSNPIISISNLYSSYITQMQNTLNLEELKELSKYIVKAQKIKILAKNRTFNSALQFKQRLNRMGVDSEAASDEALFSDIISILSSKDIAIIFTTTDNTKTFVRYIKELKDTKCKIAVFTMNPNLTFKKDVDWYINLPRISKSTTMSFIDDQPLFMVFIEILLNLIAKNIYE